MDVDTIQRLRDVTRDSEFSVHKAKALFFLIGVNPYYMVRSFIKKDKDKRQLIFVGVMQDNTVMWIVSSMQPEITKWSVSYGNNVFSDMKYDKEKQKWSFSN